jgi:cytochrome P450
MSTLVAHDLQQDFAAASISLARFPEESLLYGSGRAYVRNGLEFYEQCERIASIVDTRFLWKRVYIITDPAAIADVLVHHPKSFIKPYLLRRLKVLFGDGLLTSDGDTWLHRRRLMQPAFGSDHMSAFLALVRENTERMIRSWQNGDARDVYREFIELCMRNISQTMFGVYDEELASIVRALAATCHELVHSVLM